MPRLDNILIRSGVNMYGIEYSRFFSMQPFILQNPSAVSQATESQSVSRAPSPTASGPASGTPSSRPWTPGSAKARKRQRKDDDDAHKQRLEAYTSALKSIAETDAPRDVHTTFGEYVAARTREMDPTKVKAVQLKIMTILLED